MTGPTKNYAASEFDAYAWIRDHPTLQQGIESHPVFTAEDDFLANMQQTPLFATSRGKTLETPLFKQPPLPLSVPSPQQEFTLTWAEEQPTPLSPPSSHPTSMHDEDASTSSDDDPSLALADFDYQFTRWAPPSASASTDPTHGIVMYDNTPAGHRIAVDNAIRNAFIDPNNNAQMVHLMHVLANTKDRDDATDVERDVGAGGAVLGEVMDDGEEGEDGEVGEYYGVDQAQHAEESGTSERLKGRPRIERKEAEGN